ncbi:MAG: glycerol-3-phosphate dehydrogenase/oxidase [Gemmatimonadaceae bacterium]
MPSRVAQLEALSQRRFDVLVVGGGITGAGIARDAVLRGLGVALIDKGDFASGTSSRSSRLVHGGVRYLEHGHLHLVFEASAERRRLLRLAPHLVRPLAFTWPVYRGQRLSVWKLSAGLMLYDLLSLFRNVARYKRLRPRDVLAHEPRVQRADLRGGVRYFDAATDDSRLTLANALDAQALGAVVANYVAFVRAEPAGGGGWIVRLRDELSGREIGGGTQARLLVNATGPWNDMMRGSDATAERTRVQGSKGTHVSVRRERVGNRDAITLLHPADGRVMFALPAGVHTIIGTTDTFTDVPPDDVRASRADVEYLLSAANLFFPDARLAAGDVIAAWAGIRPLMPTSGSSVAASREHAIVRDDQGTVTITGGKLTTYRVMARDAVDAAQEMLGMRTSRADTGTRPLPGADVDVALAVKEAMRATGDASLANRLVQGYGSAWRDVQAYCARDHAAGAAIVDGLPYRMGEMRWSLERELAFTLGDLLIRRTRIAFETPDNGRSAARAVAAFLGMTAADVERYDLDVARMFAIDP